MSDDDRAGTAFGPVMKGRTSRLRRGPLSTTTGRSSPHDGPSGRGRSTRRRVGRVMLRTLAVVLAVGLLAGVGLVLYVSAQIERRTVEGLERSNPTTILVTGSDSREGMTREEQLELTTGSEGGDLTDTIFLLQAQGGRTAMLAFPRDLYVTRCDGSRGRINGAVRIGGPSCLVETITDLSGIEISHHLEVDFLGFREIVDAVGGVEMCLDRAISDRDAGIDLPAGCQTLDGVDALGYVRVRKIDNDLERIKRQQQFVRALATTVLSDEVLRSPARLLATATAAADAVTADARLGPIDMVRLGWSLRGLAGGLDSARTVPGTDAVIGGASVLTVDEAAATALFADFDDGTLLARGGPTAAPAPAPSSIAVTVLNGTGTEGLAGQVAGQLRQIGFQVTSVGNAAPTDASQVRFPPDRRAAAEVVRDRSGRSLELVADPGLEAVTIVLGTDTVADG